MLRFILIVILVLMVWSALSAFFSGLRKGLTGETRRPAPPPQGPAAAETLVRCAACGVHVPRSRAFASNNGDGLQYCTERCRSSARARAG